MKNMKKNLLLLFTLSLGFTVVNSGYAQTRYIDEIFSSATKTANVLYDSNRSVNILYGTPYPIGNQPILTFNLLCDIYQPAADVQTKRPLIILAHTGSFLPPMVNRQVTGSKDDSSIVEIATKFAKRGFVVVAMNNRLGWNPATTIQEQATEQLIKATYRGMQDVRNCVRFMRLNAATYGIDTSKIIAGGQATGGYITLALGSVDKRSELESNLKFLRGNATAMVNMDTLGDWYGVGGWPYLNYGGDPSVSSNIHMTFNWGGAMGDSAWIQSNSLPHIGLHCPTDVFAPYKTGNVVIPGSGITVIPNASGAGDVMPKMNSLGINAKMGSQSPTGNETEISKRAAKITNNVTGLYPFISSFPAEGAPWEWWDRTIAQGTNSVSYKGYPVPVNGREADSLSMLTNPLMSAARGKAYCDTIVRFCAPRIALQLGLTDQELSSFAIISPANAMEIEVRDTDDFVVFKWNKAIMTGVGSVSHRFMVDAPAGTWQAPLINEDLGDVDSIAVLQSELFANLTLLGIQYNQTLDMKWTVVADNNVFMRMADNENGIKFTKRYKVGINEYEYNSYLNIYPNPATSTINIEMDLSKAMLSTVSVTDLVGRTVVSSSKLATYNHKLDVSGLTPGMYIVKATLEDGAVASKRVLVK